MTIIREKPGRRFPKPLSGRPFQGLLKVPLKNLDPRYFQFAQQQGLAIQPTYQRANEEEIMRQLVERLEALAEHYKLKGLKSRNASQVGDLLVQLLFNLAPDFIVGFNNVEQIGKTRPGREKGVGQQRDDLHELQLEVNKLVAQKKKFSERRAIGNLCNSSDSKWNGLNPSTLRQQLHRWRKGFEQWESDLKATIPYLEAIAAVKRTKS